MTDTVDYDAALEAFFKKRCADPDSLKVVRYEPIIGGYSRAMARVWVEDSEGRRGYVVRADPPPGHSILETDRAEEWDLLSTLHAQGTIPMPAPLWFDADGAELGSPSIVLDLVEGGALVNRARAADTSEYASFSEPLCTAIAAVHSYDLSHLPEHLEVPDSWDAYIDSRIQRWLDAEAAHVESNPFMRMIAAWLDANRPPPAPLALVHGDFQIGNVLVGKDGSFVLVDWELTHVGDPREDLGWWALAGVTVPPDIIAADEEAFYARYRELTGLTEEQLNPAVVAYFTVLASDSVFINVINQLAGVARGDTTAMTVAYMSNAVAGMHEVFWNAIAKHDELTGAAS